MPDTLSFFERVRRGFNAFRDRDPTVTYQYNIGPASSTRPDRPQFRYGTEKSLTSSVYTRIGIDAAAFTIQHVRLDQNGRFLQIVDSGINNCLTLEANIDQTGASFIQDVVMSMCDEGAVAIVPVDTELDPTITNNVGDVFNMRTGKIVQWYPRHVRVELYNEDKGIKQQITLPKRNVAIVENPLYSVMNERNSTLKRLIRKLNLLDSIDDQSGKGKIDILVQVPYALKTDLRKEEARKRRAEIEDQLANSTYGIGYIDSTEKVTQLNRPVENNLMAQIEFLTNMLWSQLGLTESIFKGEADEKVMLNYHDRTIIPILKAITDSMNRRFLTKTARSQGQSIVFYKDPFSLVPISMLGDIADKLTRNAILTPNEIRAIVGYKPSGQQGADTLSNKNLNQPADQQSNNTEGVNVNG